MTRTADEVRNAAVPRAPDAERRGRAAPAPRASKSPARRLLEVLGSLRLTVPLFALAIFLTFAGTLAQVELGIWTVMDQYFRTLVARIDLDIFFPRQRDVPGWFPFPGGYLIGGALFVNLVAAYALRMKVVARGARLAGGIVVGLVGAALVVAVCFERLGVHPGGMSTLSHGWAMLCSVVGVTLLGAWLLFGRRGGVVVAHVGLAVLLVSELITGTFADEGQMVIREGAAANFVEDIREPELLIVDPRPADHDLELAIPAERLEAGAVITHPELPFDVRIERYHKNADIVRAAPGAANPATAGLGLQWVALARPEASGTDQETVNAPAVYFTALDKASGAPLGTWLVSFLFEEFFTGRALPQAVTAGGAAFPIGLRFRRTYQPYTVELLEFRHDVYPGTTVPKDFSSFVRLSEPGQGEPRQVRIWMNHPLRYRGQTFYQQGYRGEDTTILQVVANPGWAIPYVSCVMVGLGLLVHFLTVLTRFLGQRRPA